MSAAYLCQLGELSRRYGVTAGNRIHKLVCASASRRVPALCAESLLSGKGHHGSASCSPLLIQMPARTFMVRTATLFIRGRQRLILPSIDLCSVACVAQSQQHSEDLYLYAPASTRATAATTSTGLRLRRMKRRPYSLQTGAARQSRMRRSTACLSRK